MYKTEASVMSGGQCCLPPIAFDNIVISGLTGDHDRHINVIHSLQERTITM